MWHSPAGRPTTSHIRTHPMTTSRMFCRCSSVPRPFLCDQTAAETSCQACTACVSDFQPKVKAKGGEQRGGHEIRDGSCFEQTLAWQTMIKSRWDAGVDLHLWLDRSGIGRSQCGIQQTRNGNFLHKCDLHIRGNHLCYQSSRGRGLTGRSDTEFRAGESLLQPVLESISMEEIIEPGRVQCEL